MSDVPRLIARYNNREAQVSKSRILKPRRRWAACGIFLVAFLAAGLTACGDSSPLAAQPFNASGGLSISPGDGVTKADPNKPVTVTAKGRNSRITDVMVVDNAGRLVRGELADSGTSWHTSSPLAAGARYTVRVSTADSDGSPGRGSATFTTAASDKLLRATFGPDGKEYGVGQPVTAQLSHKVTDPAARALVERGLRVTSTPAAHGRWYWVDDQTLHYRPEEYWPAHATVTVESRLDGTRIQDGLYGGSSPALTFRTRDRIVALVDAAEHRMTVTRNGKEIRTIPVTTGKPGFDTRNGVKVVLEQEEQVRMTGTSIGIAAGSSESYDLDVRWATRVTWSGEFVHAAPWSVGSQGYANVSHGCTGMSTEAAEWFFKLAKPGDVVKVVNSEGSMMTPFDNGYGDWNLDWAKWRQGSALDKVAASQYGIDQADLPVAASARLRPQQS
ncbi:L,D-transpeptidase [Wenjunlia tyrosinilytica]|uniref:L,D-TPase catalytic domain-containing protein n=1 Tax=Wenjunlia tyrosinilytica TaxID=1544741 RepID=A0A917ZFY6_9ACTN|nr:Ig-like domain-containing protein [Wenjunlia tyrosinilytica]GGO82036.1 hypothetical protein GCM10012280_07730 [Wenjunlia tyrosinilytica]